MKIMSGLDMFPLVNTIDLVKFGNLRLIMAEESIDYSF